MPNSEYEAQISKIFFKAHPAKTGKIHGTNLSALEGFHGTTNMEVQPPPTAKCMYNAHGWDGHNFATIITVLAHRGMALYLHAYKCKLL